VGDRAIANQWRPTRCAGCAPRQGYDRVTLFARISSGDEGRHGVSRDIARLDAGADNIAIVANAVWEVAGSDFVDADLL
jgi:hypothetical protein